VNHAARAPPSRIRARRFSWFVLDTILAHARPLVTRLSLIAPHDAQPCHCSAFEERDELKLDLVPDRSLGLEAEAPKIGV
jgi:hypothetical protein